MSTTVITESATLGNGQQVSTTTTLPTQSTDGVIELDHTIDIGALNSTDINVGLVIDTSGSTSGSSGSDVDGDGTIDTFLEAQVAAAKELFQTYANAGYDPSRVTITLVEYGSQGTVIGTYNLNQFADFEADLDNLDSDGLTNFADPLDDLAGSWASQGVTSSDSNTVVFLSDGVRNTGGDFRDEVQDLEDDYGASITAIGVGANSRLSGGLYGRLNAVDNTGGAVKITDVSQLVSEITLPPPNVDVDSVTVTYSYEDPADPSNTITVTNIYNVGDPMSPLIPTPSGYALNDLLIDLDPDPPVGTDISVSVTTSFDDGATLVSTGDIEVLSVVCFAAETMIATTTGAIAACDLTIGHLVQTMDHGHQPIRWIGIRHVDARELATHPKLRPIRIKAGSLGRGLPVKDLLVSRQHRVMLRSAAAKHLFGVQEVLVAAIRLTGLKGIDIAEDVSSVTYVHFLFDSHEIVYSEGAPTESLFLGPETMKSIPHEQLQEIQQLFGDQIFGREQMPSARYIPQNKQQNQLVRLINDR